MRMTFDSSFEIIINVCKCHVNAFRTVFLNNCECLQRSCARGSWFVLNFRIVLLDLLVGCDVRRKKRFIRNNYRNSFQYEFRAYSLALVVEDNYGKVSRVQKPIAYSCMPSFL